MCGIAGIFLLDSANKDKLKSIEKMTEALTHRGPDSVILKAGYFNEGFVRDIWLRFLNDKLNFRERLIFARFVMFCVWYKYNFVVSGRNN